MSDTVAACILPGRGCRRGLSAAKLRARPRASRSQPLAWSGWSELAAPVRTFLAGSRGRSWAQLRAWVREHSMKPERLVNAGGARLGRERGEENRLRWVLMTRAA